MKRELIYVAGPYSSDVPEMVGANVATAIYIGIEIYKKGHIPFIPHLNYLVDEYAKNHNIPMSYDDYMAIDEPFRQKCDALYYIESSPGTDIEMMRSWNEGKRIYYSLDEIQPVD